MRTTGEGLTVRSADHDDLRAAAELRLRWLVEDRGSTPLTSRADFVASFAAWGVDHDATHTCSVAVLPADDGTRDRVVGLAWLAVQERVPTPSLSRRATGDVQSVYVAPEHRGAGVAARLVDALLAEAWHRGLERVTVHSDPGAVRVYERAGFTAAPTLLEIDRPAPAADEEHRP